MQSATHLAHKSSLSVRCLFSISFVWILGTRVIHFKVKTRQRDQKKKKPFFPPDLLSEPPLESPTASWQAGDPVLASMHERRDLGRLGPAGGRSLQGPPSVSQFMCWVTVLFTVGPLSDS